MVALDLRFRAASLRAITYIFSLLDRYFSTPIPPQPSFRIKIPTRDNGAISVLFYMPKGTSHSNSSKQSSPLPAVINFHGGGWTFGTPQMDARWASQVTAAGMVCISIGYRLAPSHPFPGPLDDVEDATRWLWDHASEFGIDRQRIALSGFSAGGNMVFALALRIAADGQKDQQQQSKIAPKGILSFYPLVDRTKEPEQKAVEHPESSGPVAVNGMQKIFEASYLPEGKQHYNLEDPDLSPALVTDEVVTHHLPKHIGIWTCEHDYLMTEGELFRQRLSKLGKATTGSMVKGVVHAWDRYPTFWRGNPKMDRMYKKAIEELRIMMQ